MKELHRDIVAVRAGQETRGDVVEVLRRSLVFSMKRGETWVLNCDKQIPDWRAEWNDEEELPLCDVLDWEKWHQRNEYMRIVREHENEDFEGNKGNFELREDMFNIVILFSYTTDQDLVRFTKGLPN